MTNSEEGYWQVQLSAGIRRFAVDSSGATIVEYTLIVAIIGAVLMAGTTPIGTRLNEVFGAFASVFN